MEVLISIDRKLGKSDSDIAKKLISKGYKPSMFKHALKDLEGVEEELSSQKTGSDKGSETTGAEKSD